MRRRTARLPSRCCGCLAGDRERDLLAVEEPLEIRIGGLPVAVTMRTPGHDEELALGFCLSEGLRPAEARLPDDLAANVVEVDAPGFDPARLQRSFYTSSSCGVCGKGALEAVAVDAPRVESTLTVTAELVSSLPDRLRAALSRPSPRPAACTRPGSSTRRASSSACARTSAATTRSTRSSAGRSRTTASRSPTRSSASAAGSRSSSCRRRPSPAARSSSRSALPRASPSSSPPTAASRSAASSAAAAMNVYTEPWRIEG